ncbi:unnamed protein product [Effrenium voratum]|nr:unnamed protein product [Effrenium voratum]
MPGSRFCEGCGVVRFCEGCGLVRSDAGARLDEIRAQLDAVATEHCQAVMGGAPRPDLAGIPGLLAEVQRLLPDLPSSERAKADMMMGCGWHMLGEDEKALEPLLRAVSSQGLAVSDHLSAILVVMPLLRQRCRWSQLLQAGEKAYDLAGRWVDPVLPFMKGVALSRLNCMEQAADCLEEAIQMKPGLKQAHLEFQQAAAELGDTQRCRRVAQLLVDHGGYWVSSLQRPLHFDPKVRSQPWHDPRRFKLVHALEDNFGVICAELEAMERRWGKVGSGHRGNENSRHDADLVTAGEWQEVVLLGDSQECQDNCASCPRTSELLQSFPEVASCAAAKLGELAAERLNAIVRASLMARRAVAWLRNDLRLHDNEIFQIADVQVTEFLAVYCIDPRHYSQSTWGDHRRCAQHRSRLLAESLEALAASLAQIGSRLLVCAGRPEEVMPSVTPPGSVLLYQAEDTHEEQEVEEAVLRALPGVDVKKHFGQTLRHRDDLGFDLKEWLPLPFGKFYHETCSQAPVRPPLPAPGKGDLPPPPDVSSQVLPETSAVLRAMGFQRSRSRDDVGVGASAPSAPPAGDFRWRGGEAAALQQLEAYCAKPGLGSYQRTRNQLQVTCSSRLSPWMAIGCLSPRTVFWRAQRFERENGQDADQRFDHVQKFIFQLCWRDYFHFYCTHFGRRVFFAGGPAARWRPWRRCADLERRWKQGRTGVPLVDALMRELSETGFMANRGRYVVASYLVFFLHIDWRVGADWFESLLLDHDVCSNYGEWASMANVAVDLGEKHPLGLKGRGPSGGRRPNARGGGGDP